MRLEHHLVGGYVRYISPYIIIIIMGEIPENTHPHMIYFSSPESGGWNN